MVKGKDMSKLKTVYEKYSAIVPAPLSSQFPDRTNKTEAVKHHIERTQKETTKLYPSGKRHVKGLYVPLIGIITLVTCTHYAQHFAFFLNAFVLKLRPKVIFPS